MQGRILHILARAILLAVLLALVWARSAGAQPRIEAAPGAHVYWVDQQHARADDRNPGSRDLPWKTIGRAAREGALQPGDVVVVRTGVYRESVKPQSGGSDADHRVSYLAFPGDDVVVSGADLLNAGWERYSGAWKHVWTTPLPAYGEREFRREMVIVDGKALRPVYSLKDLRAGTFFVEGTDRAPSAIYMIPTGGVEGRQIEVAVRSSLFSPDGKECGDESQPGWLRVAGFTFRHAANRAQWGAICIGSRGSLLEENTVEWTNGLGIDVSGRDHVFRANRSIDNGQMGFGGSCSDCLLTDNESSRNNWKGHNPFWEAGGGKFVHTRNTVIRRHTARDNNGPGLWFDIDNEDNTVEYSRFAGNSVAGILLELATVRTLVRGNLVLGTRWLGWSGSGLLAQASSQNVIVENTFAHNDGTGVWIRLDPDRRSTDGYNLIYNNLFVANAGTTEGDAREISIRGYDPEHARTNLLDGNVYWPHPSSMRVSTFYFAPDAAREANFRSDDLAAWQELTGGDARAIVLKSSSAVFERLRQIEASELPIGSGSVGVTVPLPLEATALTHRTPLAE